MIEILISLWLLLTIFLGMDVMQIKARQVVQEDFYFFVASEQLQSIMQRIKARQGHLSENEIANWYKQNQMHLPQGVSLIRQSQFSLILMIGWGGFDLNQCKKNLTGRKGCIKVSIRK